MLSYLLLLGSDMSDEIDDENGLDDDPHTVKLRYAKNVDNPNEGVFVRCKGTLYRARKCPQVTLFLLFPTVARYTVPEFFLDNSGN